MAAAKKIAQAIAARVAAEEALKAAEAAEAAEGKAYREAERNGWTKTELNKLKPTKKRRAPQKKQLFQSLKTRINLGLKVTLAVQLNHTILHAMVPLLKVA